MTMTPERRQEIGERLKLYKSGTPCKPQAAFAEVLRLWNETLADNDSLTAENATLKGEVIQREFDLIRAGKTQETLERERDAALYDCAALRTHLKAVVEAGEEVVEAAEEYTGGDRTKAYGFRRVWYEYIDALRSALDKAKGAV